jgi:hypothetical protein
MRYLGIDIGTSFIKGAVLDADTLRLSHIERMDAPLLVSGLDAWFQAGACAVGIGRELIPKNHVETGDYAAVTLRVKEVCEWVEPARANRRK